MPSREKEQAPHLRLVDILTTASSIASARNAGGIGVEELLLAVRVVDGSIDIEDVGGEVHPLLIRGNVERPVQPQVRELIQRWYAELGGALDSALNADDARRFVAELKSLYQSESRDGASLE